MAADSSKPSVLIFGKLFDTFSHPLADPYAGGLNTCSRALASFLFPADGPLVSVR